MVKPVEEEAEDAYKYRNACGDKSDVLVIYDIQSGEGQDFAVGIVDEYLTEVGA